MKFINLIFISFILTSCQNLTISNKDKLKSNYNVDIARGFINHNKNPEAISALNESLRLNPHNAEAKHLLAICLYQRGRVTESINYFKDSLVDEPAATKVRNDLITVLIEQKRYREAFANAVKSVNDLTYTDPQTSYFLKAQAALKLSKKNPKFGSVAKKSLLTTLSYNPNHCGALYHLADYYKQRKALKEAYGLYHKSLAHCEVSSDKIKALNELIPLSKKFGLVYQWGRYKQLQAKLTKKNKTLQ